MKLLGLRLYYFKQPWNVFDFCVVVMSILGQSSLDIYVYVYFSERQEQQSNQGTRVRRGQLVTSRGAECTRPPRRC